MDTIPPELEGEDHTSGRRQNRELCEQSLQIAAHDGRWVAKRNACESDLIADFG